MTRKTLATTIIGGGAIAIGLMAFGPTGAAHADGCTILVPGHQDDNGTGYLAQLDATHQLPRCYAVAQYPTDIAPIQSQSGNPPLTMDDATNIAADQIEKIYQSLPHDQPVVVRTYSEGAAGGLKWANRHICGDQNGCGQLVPLPQGVTLEQDGDPYGSTGMLSDSPWVQNALVGPIVNAFGVPTDLQTPANTQRNFSQNDLVANAGPQGLNVIADGSMLLTFGAHGVQDPAKPHVTWQGPNGEINHEWDVGVNPLSAKAIADGGACDQACNDANNVMNPINNGFDPDVVQIPQISPNDVGAPPLTGPVPGLAPPNFAPPPDFVPPAPLAVIPPDTAAPVVQQAGSTVPRSATPEFFGEMPCADGMFTPGDAAC